jgi:Ca2+-dependent lipid-binding protein
MSLEVTVVSATNLPNLESMGKIDPYVNVEFQGQLMFLLCDGATDDSSN